MPPHLALFASFFLIAWLFRQDAREPPVGSKALWVPAIWLLILSTRPIAYWIGSAENLTGSTRDLEGEGGPGGSPADLAVLGLLILACVRILVLRRIDWGIFFRENRTLLALYFFFVCSLAWSAYPVSGVKRIVKDFSVVLFALAILTEVNPSYAIRKLFLRCSYIVFTLSVVTIKYFPHIGTNRTRAGENMFTGLTTQKNTLGTVVFTYFIVLLWDLLQVRREEKLGWTNPRIVARCLMLALGVWLLFTCDSKTSLLCLAIGLFLYWGTGRLLAMRNPKKKLLGMAFAFVVLMGLDSTFQIKETIVQAMGRDLTFTGRTDIWDQVLAQPVNRFVGAGFMMFWDGEFGRMAVDEMGVRISTAHNGYVEILLDGGFIGLALLALMLLERGNSVANRMVSGEQWARFALIYWVLALFHNLSESTFFRFSILWFFLILSIISPPPAFATRSPAGQGANLPKGRVKAGLA